MTVNNRSGFPSKVSGRIGRPKNKHFHITPQQINAARIVREFPVDLNNEIETNEEKEK